ncbi:MAG: S9 family peptidase [Acidobacteria bacterium]|nr:S9 family peptidase [Acidobacteriota bacterium]
MTSCELSVFQFGIKHIFTHVNRTYSLLICPIIVIGIFLTNTPAAVAQLPKLIPHTVLFGNPEKTSPLVSPDGKKLAYLAPNEKGVNNLWVRTLGQPDDHTVTDLSRSPSYGRFLWQPDSEHLIYFADQNGNEVTHLFQVHLQTKVIRDLTPFPGVVAELIATSVDFPDQILVAMNLRDPAVHDAYRINLKTGAVTLDTQNPGDIDGLYGWKVDQRFRIRAAIALLPDGGTEIRVRNHPKAPWRTLQKWAAEDTNLFVTGVVGFTPDNQAVWVTSSVGVNAARLLKVDLMTGKSTVVVEDNQFDVPLFGNRGDSILLHPRKHTLEAVLILRERADWKVLDPSLKVDFETLKTVRDGDFEIVNRDLNNRIWVVSYDLSDGPTTYYTYDRVAKQAQLLFTDRPALEQYQLAKMQPISFQARDGMKIYGYLTLPTGVPSKNLPMMVFVHGGPWIRDSWGFDPTVQWMANRGYAVLQVNYRGSSGYGKAYLNTGNREWGAKMNTDLIDGKNWVVSQGMANPKKVGIYGYSYGGYAVLAALAFTPDEFACGIDQYGISELIEMIKFDPAYTQSFRPFYDQRMGNIDTEPEFLKSRSPLYKADQIKVPLLIAQGTNDVRVTQLQSDLIAEAMRKNGKPVEYLLFAGEGHGGWRPESRLKFIAAAEQFLAKYLGGRTQPKPTENSHSGAAFYERIAAKLSANPELEKQLGKPAPEMDQLKWLIGTWEITTRVFATQTTSERTEQGQGTVTPFMDGTWLSLADSYGPNGPDDQGFMSYDPFTKKWISLAIDKSGIVMVTMADGWKDNRLIFCAPPVEILGVSVQLRQILEKRSETEYRILNEEQLPNGEWVPVDEYIYRKK